MDLKLPNSLIFRRLSLFHVSCSFLEKLIHNTCLYWTSFKAHSVMKAVSPMLLLQKSCWLQFDITPQLPEIAVHVGANKRSTKKHKREIQGMRFPQTILKKFQNIPKDSQSVVQKVHKVNIIFITVVRYYLQFLLSFSHNCAGEFFRVCVICDVIKD